MTPHWTIRLRGLIFVLVAGWMIGGPMYRQVFNGRSRIPRSWVMFTGYGAGEVCDVRYTLKTAEGEAPLDRYAVLGHDTPRSAPRSVRRVENKKAAQSLGRRLCRALESDADVRLYARCAHRKGWRVVDQGLENLCAR